MLTLSTLTLKPEEGSADSGPDQCGEDFANLRHLLCVIGVPVSGKIYSLMVSLAPPQCSKVPKRESKATLPQVAKEVCYSCSGTSSPQSCDRGGAHSCNTAVPRHGIRALLGRIIFSCGTIGSFLGFSSLCNLAPACLWQWKTSSDTAKCPQPDKTKPSWEPLWNTVALGQVAALLKFSF